MKKIILSSLVAVIMVFDICAGAVATSLDVLSLNVTQDTADKIWFGGITDDGVLAVSCKILDKDGNEEGFVSVAVDSGQFSGEFDVSNKEETYHLVKCANYDGGVFVTEEVTFSAQKEDVKTNDKSGDGNDANSEIVIPKVPDTGVAK